ncbi:type II toxin-antitoxin system Phd/YefM family antitoxin [Rhodoferax sp.]|uniref:type II toxin-antitoxin system Phd/YefM family antitoxin n=1 Tax=Rhodoferax sp. TaxID=50421 RepID=UPI0027641CD5|nr:type II toxin-antitoxin system Phd/YefM family antitoxin [Rhodoferax sp.]
MTRNTTYGLEQARIHLPLIIAQAHTGVTSVITRHGKPYAAVVSIKDMEKTKTTLAATPGVLALRGMGKGLWGRLSGATVAELRDEWDRV